MTTIDQIMELADHWNSSVVDSIWLSEQGCDTTNIDDQTIEFKEKLKAAITELVTKAAMYEWIKAQKSLLLETDGSTWHRDGNPFIASHRLAVDGIQYGAYESLDELINEAMKGAP